MTKAPLENIVSWSLIDPLYSIVSLFAFPTPNLMSVMQSKYISSQAFPAYCPSPKPAQVASAIPL